VIEKEILKDFILNNKDLEKLESHLAQFNVFEVLNIVNTEIRHSYVLAWLLNPNANHGCGDYFVKLFLKYIYNIERNSIEGKLTIFDLEAFDYSDLEIKREWSNIDILIISEKNKFIVAIENKISSSEHGNQLKRYRETISKEFPNYEKVFVYLSPEEEICSDENWVIFGYKTILKILTDLIEYNRASLGGPIINFLEQYATIVRRDTVGNSEIAQICKSIYKKHQKALDIIFQYKDDKGYEVSRIVQGSIASIPGLVLDAAGRTIIRFTTSELDKLIPKVGTGEWGSNQRILMFEFKDLGKRFVLRLIIGPGESEMRNKLHKLAMNNVSLFNTSKGQIGLKWKTIYQSEYLKKSDYDEVQIEQIEEKINKKFKLFLEEDLNKITKYFRDNLGV
jgi:hypothetical protein